MRSFASALRLGWAICAFPRLSARSLYKNCSLSLATYQMSVSRSSLMAGCRHQKRLRVKSTEAIRWRNDPDISDNLVIVGDLERDRAAGLASVPTIRASEVRHQLLDQLIREAQSRSASAKTVKLLQALKSERVSADLQHLADYAQSLAPSLGISDLDHAVSNLWQLKLLPDRASADVDIRRLRDNAQRVNELRQSDATTIQRLIQQLASQDTGNYEALRLFASTGKTEYLRGLRLDAVRDALRSARADAEDGPTRRRS